MLLLDEPSARLNREEREDLARHILRIKHERGLAMICVEHDMQMVADLADRLYVLNFGEHLADDPPRDGRRRSRRPGLRAGRHGHRRALAGHPRSEVDAAAPAPADGLVRPRAGLSGRGRHNRRGGRGCSWRA